MVVIVPENLFVSAVRGPRWHAIHHGLCQERPQNINRQGRVLITRILGCTERDLYQCEGARVRTVGYRVADASEVDRGFAPPWRRGRVAAMSLALDAATAAAVPLSRFNSSASTW